MVRGFWGYIGGAIVRPRRTFDALANDPRALRYGTTAILLIGAMYTATVAMLAAADIEVFAPPFLAIPRSDYYRWEQFFALPAMLLGWVAAGGFTRLAARALGGTGGFEQTLGLLGLPYSVPLLVTWVPETIGAVLFVTGRITRDRWLEMASEPGVWKVLADSYQYISIGWLVVLLVIAVGSAERLALGSAVLAAVAGLVPFAATMAVLIR